ncbi:VOC family protein [Streptomyces prasinus]
MCRHARAVRRCAAGATARLHSRPAAGARGDFSARGRFATGRGPSRPGDPGPRAPRGRSWAKLVEGGGEHGPCGWLKDRFGLSWQVVPTRLTELIADPDPRKAARAMKAMLSMGKLDIAELERAHAGG